jgi:HNH endonuclease
VNGRPSVKLIEALQAAGLHQIATAAVDGFCGCGCGRQTAPARGTDRRRGLIKGRPTRFLRWHGRRPILTSFFLAGNGCWIWTAGKDLDGYGFVKRDGVQRRVHRWFYELVHGVLPKDVPLDHLCQTPSCVNPAHVEPVTVATNTQRGRAAKLTQDDLCLIRERGGTDQAALAKQLGVSQATISRAYTGESWREVPA